MKLQEIREIARKFNMTHGGMKKVDLIRAIQLAEGNQACFGTGRAQQCGQKECAWREDCD